jgi:phage terminase Nu1 subunit (DNA packaging protein)
MDLDALLTTDEAGDLLGLTGRRILQLIQDGYVARAQRGRVKLRDLVRGYGKSLKAGAEGGTNADAQAALARKRAEMLEIEIAKKRNELVDVDLCISLQQMLAGAVVAELANWSSRVTKDAALRAAIDREVSASLDRIRQTAERGASELFGPLDGDDDEAEAA